MEGQKIANALKNSTIIKYENFYSKTSQMHQCLKFILFWNGTLHISDGLSVHHQEFTTLHTATGICQADTAVCLLAIIYHVMVHDVTS